MQLDSIPFTPAEMTQLRDAVLTRIERARAKRVRREAIERVRLALRVLKDRI